MLLAHWKYSKEEWQYFIRHTKKRKGLLSWLLRPFYLLLENKIPEVKITPDQVWIGDDRQHFNNKDCELTTIDLRDEGKINILSIGYKNIDTATVNEIKILVPKGKLREAVEVQERLTYRT